MPQDEMTVEQARNNLQELKEGDLAGIAKGPPTEDEAQEEAPAEEAFLQLPPNLAKKTQLVAKAITKIEEYFRTFDAQSPRTKAKSDWKEADARYRVSKSKANKNPTNQEDNRLANVPSTSFYNTIRITTAGQKAIIYYGDNLPVEYTPAIGSPDFPDDAEAKRIADEQNFLLWYTWHKANVETATKAVLHYTNKYKSSMISCTWDRTVDQRVERDSQGNPANLERIVSDWPAITRHDLRYMWFDSQIDNMQLQNCIVQHIPQVPRDVLELRRKDYSEYENLDQLTDAHLFGYGNNDGTQETEDLQANAGEAKETRPTGNYSTWYIWVKLPIVNGKWDKKAIPTWFESTWAGNAVDQSLLCLQLRANPYWHKMNPYQLVHSHEDDKGAYHMGYLSVLSVLCDVETAAIEQWLDCRTLNIRAPYIGEKGSFLGTTLPFRANKIVWVRAGTGKTALTKMKVDDITGNTIPFLATIKENLDRTGGMNAPMSGEEMKSRTTATVGNATMQQAMKPALEDTKFLADQIFPWMARMFAELWRQFGDPERVLWVTRGDIRKAIKPTRLYGEYGVRVVSIGQFENDVIQQATMNDFMARNLPLAVEAGIIDKKGLRELYRDVMKSKKMSNVDRYLAAGENIFAAERDAWSENRNILLDGTEDMPVQEEDHSAHIRIHKPIFEKYKLLPAEDQNSRNASMMSLHIMAHEQFERNAASLAAQLGQVAGQEGGNQYGPPGAETGQPGMMGEAAGDMRGGTMGGMGLPGTAGEEGPME